jgi:hypothetical protein
MMIEIKCPDCEKIHLFEIDVRGYAVTKVKDNGEVLVQYGVDEVEVKAIIPDSLINENI